MKPLEMAEVLFGNEENGALEGAALPESVLGSGVASGPISAAGAAPSGSASVAGASDGSVDSSAMAAVAAHLKRGAHAVSASAGAVVSEEAASASAATAAHLGREGVGPAPVAAPASAAGRDEEETRAGGVTLLGNQGTRYPSDYDPSVLETFVNKHQGNDYFVKFNCPEFTSLCPITGQPDFATVYISYVPDVRMVESKSLKLYLFSFRNHGDFHEDCMNIIMKDLIALMDPKYIEVWGKFTPRGGISIDPYCNYGRPGTRWEDVAWQRLAQHDLYPEKVDNR